MADKGTKSHRELIDTGKDKRFVKRDDKGQFDEVADVGRSLTQDRKQVFQLPWNPRSSYQSEFPFLRERSLTKTSFEAIRLKAKRLVATMLAQTNSVPG